MRTIDLFSGCGGLSLGFQNAGFDIVAAYDNWQAAIQVYKLNFAHPIYQVDLGNLSNYVQLEELAPDMIIGGPPCQDYSSAGKRDESLGRADLTITYASIVSSVKPQWFVMENVERIISSKNYKEAKRVFRQAGYALTEHVLNASLCGVPQNRKRLFLVGELNGIDDALTPYFIKNTSLEAMTVYDYLGDSLGIEYYYRHPRSYARRAVFSIHEPSPTVRGVNRPIPETYKRHPGDSAPVGLNVRPLTTLERSYLQTFPQNFVFKGSKTELEQLIGNAVPVKLAEFVANCIREYMLDKAEGKQITAASNEHLQLSLL
ncbi:MAG: DNA cytosine methyltransferase [Chloroflexi bacterium]|nr:DNA cytosine methyltransferase [Chloroflexota bacterium]MCC6893427.1 DNA cytosine methyltransferase [Anaerolineae bacterium]